mgnify:CR=1 FL=1
MARLLSIWRIWIKYSWYFLYSMYLRKPWSLAPRMWLRLYFRGFLPNKLEGYDFDSFGWDLFLSDRQILLSSLVDGEQGKIMEDKFLSFQVLRGIAPTPRIWALVRNGTLENLESPGISDFGALVREKGIVILKPIVSNCGRGVLMIEYRGGIFLCNRRKIDESRLNALLPRQGELMLTEHVRQGAFTSALYPDTVNTLRMLSMIDPESKEPFIAAAAMRIGTSQSFPVDNVAAGGLSCIVDLETGRIGRVSRVFRERPFRWISRHPDNGVQMEGLVVPRWKEICAEVSRMAAALSQVPYVAWDLALLDDGISVIETNSWSELSVFQLERPLAANPAIRRFFEYHRICNSGKRIPITR